MVIIFHHVSETKDDLTQYLAGKLVTALATVTYAIAFGNTCKKNIDINENLFSYNQEEADTGIVLHALDVTLLLHYIQDICNGTTFKTRNKEIYLRAVYETLGKEICKALLGFPSLLTGCDQTGRFYGYSKFTC